MVILWIPGLSLVRLSLVKILEQGLSLVGILEQGLSLVRILEQGLSLVGILVAVIISCYRIPAASLAWGKIIAAGSAA